MVAFLGTAITAVAQDFKDLQGSRAPLVLKAQGSFFVGGEKAEQTYAQLGSFGPAGHISIHQMYVRYMVPQRGDRNVPVVMVHGMTLSGKSWETTPDGRMGWDEYFVRKGHPVYVPDQVSRGRSGFNQAAFNDVRGGVTRQTDNFLYGDSATKSSGPTSASVRGFSDEVVWPNFRFGPKTGNAYPDEQFPVAAIDELSKQSIPDLNSILPTPNPTFKALSNLAAQLKGAVLMGHSQGGSFPLEAALTDSTGVKGMILVEPGHCRPRTRTSKSRRWPGYRCWLFLGIILATRPPGSMRCDPGSSPSTVARPSSHASMPRAAKLKCSSRRTTATAATVT